jgi:hypothetical protein
MCLLELVLPNVQHLSSCRPQSPCALPLAGSISEDFLPPEHDVLLWPSGVLGTAVPEATIHKRRNTKLWKDEIWFPKGGLMTPPADDVVPTKKFHQGNLGVLVTARADPRHDV